MKAVRRSVGPSDSEKAYITAACQRFIDEVLKPKFLPTIRKTQFNYPIDILGKWQANRYRFVQRYRSGFLDNLGEEFEAPFTRLDWIARDRFNVQWHRHTGAWFCLYHGLSLAEALETIEAGRPSGHPGRGTHRMLTLILTNVRRLFAWRGASSFLPPPASSTVSRTSAAPWPTCAAPVLGFQHR